MMRSLVLAAMVTLVPLAASASPGWVIKCPYSHSNMDDPIKYPRQQGVSHLHDFYGSNSTNYLSTYISMIGSSTTCGTGDDKSGYWAPALYKNNVKISPGGSWNGKTTREQFYYRDNNYSSDAVIEPFPPNFKMIQGYAMAMSLSDANAHGAKWGSELYWGCSDNTPSGKITAPVDCATGIVTLHIGFPSCWDGVMVDGDEIASGHMRFSSGGVCPAGFSHKLPRLIQRLEYPIGPSSQGITLASGATYTAHGDFWNTWQQNKLSLLVTGCLNANKDCGTNP
jgi:hypothetical protein